ncbi:MAG: CIA30 family protein, partial [Fibrobacter sp.]|nr:CIA30 family protein [Fibrobacter sp.]
MVRRNFSYIIMLGLLALGIGLASAQTQLIKPTRVGPVSQYGQLMAGKNAQNKGRIYGSCAAYSTSGNEVQVKGMSLFWSNDETQNRYWRSDVITGEVNKQGIQLIRAAMAVDLQKWGNGHYFMNGKTEYYQDLLDETIQAAIENDIYVIIDYHSHIAAENVNRAKEFFKIQAKKWGAYDNVIFEIFNEPLCKPGHGAWADISGNMCNEYGGMITWSEIKAYAEEVIPVIRRYSDNLIVVGTPQWSARPGDVVGSAIDDPNVAYTLHFYAGFTDDGATSGYNTTNADNAISHGLSVFVTEWGTIGYDGAGTIGDPVNHSDAQNVSWQTWMNANKLSSANWNLGYNGTPNGETAAEYFTVNFDADDPATATWTYSASGQWVNTNVFAGLTAINYTQCASYVSLPSVPADDPSFDDSGDDFGDVYEDEVIPHDFVVVDFDMNNLGGGNYSYVYSSLDDPNGDWTWYIGNDGEKTFFVDGSNAGGLVKVFANDGAGWAGFGIYLKEMKGCEVLSFKYKGLANDFSFNAGSSVLIQESLIGTESWMTQSISLDGIDPVVLESPLELKWQVSGSPSGGDLYIDDVVCGEPSSSSSGDEPASSGSSFEEPGEYVVTDFDGNGKALYNYAYAYGSSGFGNTWDGTCNDGEGCYVLVMEAAAQNGTYGGGLLDITGDPKSANADASAVVFNVAVPGLSGCKVLQYSYKGAGHNFKVRLNENDDDTYIKDGFTAKTDWTVATVTVADMEKMYGYGSLGGNEGNVSDIRFEVFGQPSPDYLYIDDVECVLGEPSSSSSGDEPASSGSFEEYALSPNYDYAYAGNGWTIENPQNEGDIAATVYDDEMGGDFWGLKNVNTEEEGGYAGVGMNISNLNGCQVLSYQYIGIGHNLTFANTPDGEDVLAEWEIPSSNTWTTHTFNMSSLSGINLEGVLDIKWQVPGGENGNLYVKEIQCVLDGGSSSSSGDEPASSSSGVELPVVAAPTTNTELFDDFEDGDYMPLWEGIGNFWAETDVVAGGGSSNAELSFVKGSASAKALQMSYSLDVGDYPLGSPYAAISTNNFNEMNLSQCSEVRYDYKGAAHKFRLKVSPDMNDLLDMDWGFPAFAVTSPSESWQTVTIPVASLRQEWTGSSGNLVDVETVLQYANGFDWRVDGEDTDDKSSGTLAIDNIRCVGLAETQYYRITFMNGTEPYEAKDWAAGSNVPDPEGTPAKAPDAQFTYTFSNWTYGSDGYGNPTRYVTGTATYEAVYNSVLRAYTVTFLMDDDATPVENGVVENVNYGTPVADIVPAAPTKDADAQFTYTFGGWNPAFTDETIVTGDVSYKATFTTVTNKYSVAFVDDDETSLKTAVEYDYGTPVDQIDVPVVGDKGSLKFAGWEPGLATVTKDVTYKAVYTDKIVITWKDDDGSTLRQDFLDNGEMPEYDPAPGKDPTAEFTYTFDRWTPTVVVATENASYTASYTSVKNKYDVTFVAEHNPDANITVSKEYGEAVASFAPQVDGAVTAEYTYVFDGWMPAIMDRTVVTGGTTYTAKYKQVKNKYEVSFVGDDGVKGLPAARLVDYGTEIATLIPSTDPYKDQTVAKTYEFDRWVVKVSDTEDMELAEGAVLVAGMTLKAVFKEFDRRYVITFVDYDDTPRWGGGTLYTYGTAAADIVKPDDPSRDPDDEFSYTFAGWTPTVTAVTGEQIYKAAYTQTALVGTTYTVAFTGDADVTGIPSSMTVEEGTLVSTLLPSTNPGKPQTDEFTYTFNKWVVVNGTSETDLVAGATVTGDLTLKAVFTSVTRTYSVTFASEVGVTGLPAAATVEYGVAVSTLLPSTNPGKPQTDEF